MYERNEPDPRGDTSADRRTRSGVSPTLIAFVVIAALVVVFVLQNGERSETNFLMFDFRAPLWIALLAAVVAGILLDRLFSLWWRRRRRADRG